MSIDTITKSLVSALSDNHKKEIYSIMVRLPIFSGLVRDYVKKNSSACLISFPKCGRTWVRVMVGKALQLHLNLQETDIINLASSIDKIEGFNGLGFIHDDAAHWKKPEELACSKYHYQYKKNIFLARDPRDVVVSIYFEKHNRVRAYVEGERLEYPEVADRVLPYEGEIKQYIYEDIGSFQTILEFYNIWARCQAYLEDFLLVRYEDLHADPQFELKKILEFLDIKNVSQEVINDAVHFSSFKNMKTMETSNVFNNAKLRPSNTDDPNSYKTRKGKIGEFVRYFDQEQIDWLNTLMRDRLSPFYRYTV